IYRISTDIHTHQEARMKSSKLVQAMLIATFCFTTSVSAAPGQAKSSRTSLNHDGAAMLKQDMRKLWTDHVVWTRDYIVAAVADAPDAPSALNRLMKNQDDLGNAVAKFYGDAAGKQLTALLKDHLATAGDLVKAATEADKADQQQ